MSTTETPTTAAPRNRGSVTYNLSERGVITRIDTKQPGAKPVGIATRGEDGKVRWAHPDFVKYDSQVRAVLKKAGLAFEIMPYVVREPVMRDAVPLMNPEPTATIGISGPPVPPAAPETAQDDSHGPDGLRGLTVDQRKAVNYLRSKEGFPLGELEKPDEPMPKRTSGEGDKAPALVRWLLRFQPWEFVRRYGVQRLGSVEITIQGEIDPVSRVKAKNRRVMQPNTVIAKRATIFTSVVRIEDGQKGDDSL